MGVSSTTNTIVLCIGKIPQMSDRHHLKWKKIHTINNLIDVYFNFCLDYQNVKHVIINYVGF